MATRFEWDPTKAAINLRKHAISFDIAVRVFADPLALTVQDHIEGGRTALADAWARGGTFAALGSPYDSG